MGMPCRCAVVVLCAGLAQPLTAQAPAPAAPQLAVRAWLDKDAIRPGDEVRLWVALDNRGTREVGDIVFDDFQTPGFSPTDCWAGYTPACAAGATVASPLPRLAAGSTTVVSARLVRDNDELPDGGTVVLFGTFHWNVLPPADPPRPAPGRAAVSPAPPPVPMQGFVATSPIQLSPTRWYATPQALGLRELGKDLVLPVLLLLGGYIFQRFQHVRTERQVIWTQMLGKVTRDVEHHFLPIGAAINDLITQVDAVAAETDRAAAWHREGPRAVFALLMLNRQIVRLVDTVGGFYLRLRPAETVASVCWQGFRARQQRSPELHQALTRAVDRIEPTTSYGAFAARLASPAKPQRLFAPRDPDATLRADVETVNRELQSWVCTDDRFRDHEMVYLDILLRVLDTEVDRPFERWYGIHPHVNRPHLRQVRKRWRHESPDSWDRKVADALRHYIRETGLLWQAGLSGPWGLGLKLTRWQADRAESAKRPPVVSPATPDGAGTGANET